MPPAKLDLDQQATVANMVAEVVLLAPCGGVAMGSLVGLLRNASQSEHGAGPGD